MDKSLFGSLQPRNVDKNFIRTPHIVVREMWSVAEQLLRTGIYIQSANILEPCCGDGRILEGLNGYSTPEKITVCELNQDLLFACTAKFKDTFFYNVHIGDFLEWEPGILWDLILMNPPFGSGAREREHPYSWQFVLKALAFLNTYGVLGAILPNHILDQAYHRRIKVLERYVLAVQHIPDTIWEGVSKIHSSVVWFADRHTPRSHYNVNGIRRWIPFTE